MSNQETKQEIENLIEWIHASRENIDVLPKIAIFWHVLLGVCFTASWWVQLSSDIGQIISQGTLWSTLIGFGWFVTFLWLKTSRQDLATLSTPSKQFAIFWIIQGVLLSIIGFGSAIENAVFQVYPFVLAVLMGSLSMTISLIFSLPKLKLLVIFWGLTALVSLFLEDFTQRFLIVGIALFFAPVLLHFLQKKSN